MVVMGVLITGCTPKTKNIDIRNDEGKPVILCRGSILTS
jgi:hypothetical protein